MSYEEEAITRTIDEVFPGIGVTGLRTVLDVDLVRQLGFTAILNCSEVDFIEHTDTNVDYRWIRLIDSQECPHDEYIRAVEQLKTFIDKGRRTVVNCMAGISRSPSVVAGYLVRYRKKEMLDLWRDLQENPLPSEFRFFHSYLEETPHALAEGISLDVLDDPVFQDCATAFKVMSYARDCVYMRPVLWNELFMNIQYYLAGEMDPEELYS